MRPYSDGIVGLPKGIVMQTIQSRLVVVPKRDNLYVVLMDGEEVFGGTKSECHRFIDTLASRG